MRPGMTTDRTRRWIVSVLTSALLLGLPSVSRAQSSSDLQAARDLFAEAYRDEQEGRFQAAIDKLERVARVKETPAVRFRIAASTEGLGRLREARDLFRAVAAAGAATRGADQAIADEAAHRASALDARIPRLVVTLDPRWPAGTRASLDGNAVVLGPEAKIVEVDPGPHALAARIDDGVHVERSVSVYEGGEVRVTIPYPSSEGAVTDPPPPAGAVAVGRAPATSPDRTWGYIAVVGGGLTLVASAVLLVLRENAAVSLEEDCPGGRCPASRRTELEDRRDAAEVHGPLGIGCGIVGIAAVGVGLYLLFRHADAPAARVQAALGGATLGVRF